MRHLYQMPKKYFKKSIFQAIKIDFINIRVNTWNS